MEIAAPPKPLASVTIEPKGRRDKVPREHLVKVTLKLTASDPKLADHDEVLQIARKALGGFPPAANESDRRKFGDLTQSSHKTGVVVTGVEGTVSWAGRPSDESIERLRTVLADAGYRVSVKEMRECNQPGCLADAMIDWNRPDDLPQGWYSSSVCGKHDFKSCPKCASIYLMTCTNSSGGAPSVKCEVCGVIMVEWGSTKVWEAQLVQRRDAVN